MVVTLVVISPMLARISALQAEEHAINMARRDQWVKTQNRRAASQKIDIELRRLRTAVYMYSSNFSDRCNRVVDYVVKNELGDSFHEEIQFIEELYNRYGSKEGLLPQRYAHLVATYSQ